MTPLVFAALTALSTVEISGANGVRRQALLELLPRPMPSSYSDAELAEFERRIANLELFDEVAVTHDGPVLHVDVREKFPITPIVELSTGKTLRDTSGTLGAVHNNIDGGATRLEAYVEYAERAPQFGLTLEEHNYHPTDWRKEIAVSYTGSSFRFSDEHAEWLRTRLGGLFELKKPYPYDAGPFRYEVAASFYRERLTQAHGSAIPEDGYFIGTLSELVFDRYKWNDLVPRGFRGALELRPGAFIGPAEPRFQVRLKTLGAIPLGPRTVIAFRAVGDLVNAGNVNHSVLLGSQEGVRGLPDSFYRDQAHAFVNVELRHSFELAKRWYLQPALFTDAAAFLPMDETWDAAVSTGVGLRLIPTALVGTLLRVDGSRIYAPKADWFVQLGITQYF